MGNLGQIYILGLKKNKKENITLQPEWFPLKEDWTSIDTALTDLMPQTFRTGEVLQVLKKQLQANYGWAHIIYADSLYSKDQKQKLRAITSDIINPIRITSIN